MNKIVLTFLLIFSFQEVNAIDRFVNPNLSIGNGTTLFTTVASAVNAAVNGDRILIQSGSYNEPALNLGKSLTFVPQTPGTVVDFNSVMFLSFSSDNRNYQLECVTIETDGYVTIKIWDTKKGAKYKSEQAQKDAIHAILFSGIAGTSGCSTQPPLLNNTEEQKNFKTIEESFFDKSGKWVMFARSSANKTTLPANLGVKNWKVYQVSISKNELRKYLEEQKIIKTLTDGF